MSRYLPWLLVGLLVGCHDDAAGPAGGPSPAPSGPTARQGRVRFRGPERYAADLAAALQLPAAALCRELGQYDCVAAHAVTLGGIEPYGSGVYESLPLRSASAAGATERLALSACEERARRDFEAPAEAVLFGQLARGDASDEARRELARALYRRLLRREASPDEVGALASLSPSPAAARDHAVGACLAVATTLEALFY